jgi:hypothetical protein
MVGFILFSQISCLYSGPYGVEVQPQLEKEFRAISPLHQAKLVEYEATHRVESALVTGKYETNLSYPEIRAHYETELTRQGWKLYEEVYNLKTSEANLVRYCKGEYRANLGYGYAGADTYYFDVSWGSDSFVEERSDKFRKVGCR